MINTIFVFRFSDTKNTMKVGSKKVKGKRIDFFDSIKEYSQRLGDGNFTYTTDWFGFNLPSWVFDELDPIYDVHKLSRTPYDDIMEDIVREVRKTVEAKYDSDKFYIIGVAEKYHDKWEGSASIIQHELSHAMFFLNPEYKNTSSKILSSLSDKKKKKLWKVLKELGYCKEVFEDERSSLLSYRTSY